MKIRYALRSKFTPDLAKSITAQQEALTAGNTIQLRIKTNKIGYSGTVTITLDPDNAAEFETDWRATDPTRFPARIKAAATALWDCGYLGSFVISHGDGMLSINRV